MILPDRHLTKIPRSLVKGFRTAYLAALDFKDRFLRNNDDLTPPRSLHFVGGGNFKVIGETFVSHFIEICNLEPDETILDIGCGTGRMAVPLLRYLKGSGSYIGFDLSKKAIRWCNKQISSRNPKFSFYFADIYNKEYNPNGEILSSNYRFPCKDESIDFAFAISVFTHMRTAEIRHYLEELKRSLKPGGRAMLTFFIINEQAQNLMTAPHAYYNFNVKLEDWYTIDRQTPERAIGYSEVVLRRLFHGASLDVNEPFLYGSWSGRKSMLNTQDVVILKKGA